MSQLQTGGALSSARRRARIELIRSVLDVSERRICRVLGRHRATKRHRARGREDEERPVADMIELAGKSGSHGYRRVAVLLRHPGWPHLHMPAFACRQRVSDGRVELPWRREGLKVPPKQQKWGRLWMSDGFCVRLRPESRNRVRSNDFAHCRTEFEREGDDSGGQSWRGFEKCSGRQTSWTNSAESV